jgi:hypothetical protein
MDEIIYSNIQTKGPTCGIQPIAWGDNPDLTLPAGSHCGTVNRCLSYSPFGPTDYNWVFSYGFGALNGTNCDCDSYDCSPTGGSGSEPCNASNYGKWLVSFCTT